MAVSTDNQFYERECMFLYPEQVLFFIMSQARPSSQVTLSVSRDRSKIEFQTAATSVRKMSSENRFRDIS